MTIYGNDKKTVICSFCSKTQNDVKKIVAGASVFICNECIELCASIIKEENTRMVKTISNSIPTTYEIYKTLSQYAIGQEQAKKVLAVAVRNHYKRLEHAETINPHKVELNKSNILLIGPTGCGKTLLAQTLAKTLNVPFAIADATSLTEAGYVGEDVENILLRLLQAADYNIEKTHQGIIYIDEIDKIAHKASGTSITRDVSGEGVQQALLKIIEGTVAFVPPQGGRKHPQQDCIPIDTTNILFICGGAFKGIEKIISARKSKSSIGFNADVMRPTQDNYSDIIKSVEADDLVKFGMIPEFIGRLPVLCTLEDLDQNALVEILTKPKNALVKQYQTLVAFDGVDLQFEQAALDKIASRALKKKTGARGLRAIIEKALLDTMFDLENYQDSTIVITEEVIEGTQKPIVQKKKKLKKTS